jgi:hypothetical protein
VRWRQDISGLSIFGRPLAPLRALDRTGRAAYLGSFSKLLFPALRLSFVVLPASLVPATETIMAAVSARASLIGQGALAGFIADGHLATHLRRTRLLPPRRPKPRSMIAPSSSRRLPRGSASRLCRPAMPGAAASTG